MSQSNSSWFDRLWEIAKKRMSWFEDLDTLFPSLRKSAPPVLIVVFVGVTIHWQWERICKIGFVANAINQINAKSLPQASVKRFTVAVTHIEGDATGDTENLIIESLKSIQGIELLRFDRRSEILAAERPLDAEQEAHNQARAWLKSVDADLVVWGYQIPSKEKTVRIFMTPRLADGVFETRLPAEQTLELPAKAGKVLASAVQAQVTANVAQFDPSRNVTKELKPAVDRLASVIEHWPVSDERAKMQVTLAIAYQQYATQAGDMDYLKLAIKKFRDALPYLSGKEELGLRVMVRSMLGSALRALSEEDVRYLEEAISTYQDALQEISCDKKPVMWAALQSNLGIALHVLGKLTGKDDLIRQSVEAHKNALREIKREHDALNWALIENSLGNSLSTLAHISKDSNIFSEAIAAYESALEELNRESYPLYWGMVKTNEGGAQMFLASARKDFAALQVAHDTFQDALQVYSEETSPLNFGILNHNLGLVDYARFGLTKDSQFLRASLKSLDIALQTRTAVRTRLGWAETQFMRAQVLGELGARELDEELLGQAISAFQDAESVFDENDYPQRGRDIKDRLQRLRQIYKIVKAGKECLTEDGTVQGKCAGRLEVTKQRPVGWRSLDGQGNAVA